MKSICKKNWNFLDFLILKNFSKILEKFHFSISKLFHFTFTSWSRFPVIFISLSLLDLHLKSFFFICTSRKKWMAFFLNFSLLECPRPTLAGHWLLLNPYVLIKSADADYSFTGYKRGIKCLWRRFVSWQRSDGQEMGLTFMIFIFMIII